MGIALQSVYEPAEREAAAKKILTMFYDDWPVNDESAAEGEERVAQMGIERHWSSSSHDLT